MITADLRVLTAKDLFLNEATLTGEAMPVEKSAAPVQGRSGAPTNLPNIRFMGSNVLSGAGTAVVVQSGAGTYFGELAGVLTRQRAETSFDKEVTRFTWLMIRFMAVMVPSVFVINGMNMGDWAEALMFALAVAVGLTPQMLPMIVMVNLAKGHRDVAQARDRQAPQRDSELRGDGQYHQIHAVPRPGQLDFRLRHIRDSAVCLRRLDKPRFISDRMVRRIAADANLDHPHFRTAKIPFLQSRASMSLIATTILVAGAGALLPYSQLGPTLGFMPSPGAYCPAVFAIILGYCVLAHLVKIWFVRRWGM